MYKTIRKAAHLVGDTGAHINSIIRQVRDRDANNLGTIIEPYDGTMEGARAAAQRASDRMWDEYGDASNVESRIGATDENGKPKWAISPNLKHIYPADSVEGRAIFGDEDAIFATHTTR